MNILLLNWRDLGNPLSGGAERITHKYAKFWSEKGHHVIWLTNSYQGAISEEVCDGITIKRIGPSLVYRSKAALFFLYPTYLISVIIQSFLIMRSIQIDLIIDEIHGLPFFSPIFFKSKKVLLTCEVAGKIWYKMYPKPIAVIGDNLEKVVYRYIYRTTDIWAISKNTQKDILAINRKAKVSVLPLGIDQIGDKHITIKNQYHKKAIFLARLVKMKGIELAIDAAASISKKVPSFTLIVVGKGDDQYVSTLEQRVKDLGIQKNVRFYGFVTEQEKYKLFSQADFLFHTSYKEGFGLTVLEAAMVGTPSIVISGSSLEELVDDHSDGFIVNSAQELSDVYTAALSHFSINKLSRAARKKAEYYFWPEVLNRSKKITKL